MMMPELPPRLVTQPSEDLTPKIHFEPVPMSRNNTISPVVADSDDMTQPGMGKPHAGQLDQDPLGNHQTATFNTGQQAM